LSFVNVFKLTSGLILLRIKTFIMQTSPTTGLRKESQIMTVNERLTWRYATKKFDPTRVVPADKIERIVEAVRLAPTTSGLQPFELFIISNADIRAKIRTISWNQAQITDCSHLLVFAAWDDITKDRVDMMFDLTNDIRGFKNEGWENYRQQLLGIVSERGTEANYQAAARQAYIGLGVALIAAAFEEVDATPMEGFDPDALDDILNLKSRKLRSVVIMPLGYRAAEGDWLVNLKKVRRSRDHFATEIK
jgi:nitroreductase/dihydropteridine reductase